MPSFTIPGLSSGQNTNDLVRKLVDVESKPIRRWEKENEHNKVQIRAWTELKNQTTNLQVKTKNLTSFTSPFASKKITANEEGYLTGEAGKGAKAARQEIEIIQLASRHKIAGNKIPIETKIPPGKFSIISKYKRINFEFQGGDPDKLVEKIRISGSQVSRAAVTKVDSDHVVISLTAIQFGKESILKFLDPDGVLKTAGLVGDDVPEPPPVSNSISLAAESASPYLPEKFTALSENLVPQRKPEGIELKVKTAYKFPVERIRIPKTSAIEVAVNTGEDGRIPDYIGMGIVYDTKEGEKTKYTSIENKDGKFTFPISDFARDQSILAIILANSSDMDFKITSIDLVNPGDIVGAPIINEVVAAQDAIFKIDGIQLTRDNNENIRDALEGTSLTLLRETQNPITLEVISDTKRGLNMIREWVEAYNSLLKYSRDISVPSKDDKIDKSNASNENPELDISQDFWNNKNRSGILAGDPTIMRLIVGLKTAAGASYPSSTEPRFKVLSDIGITTGDPGSSWKQIQDGFLTINESELQNALADYPDSVRELFASDTNEDNKMDDGVGMTILETIKPYTQFTSGIVSSKVKLAESQMQENSKKIRDYESHLVNYEKKLKQKFEYMEQGIGKNKNIGTYLNQSIKQMKANNPE
jgi:flagellar hook-associated protein 2